MLLNTKTTVGLLLVILFASCGAPNPEDEIMDRLAFQTECWNSGEIDCFMIGYWNIYDTIIIRTCIDSYTIYSIGSKYIVFY